MKIKKTKCGYSFKGECENDYKLLANLLTEINKSKEQEKCNIEKEFK